MKKYCLIKNMTTNLYWYGFYTNKNWTDDVHEARFFDNEAEVLEYVNQDIFESMILSVVHVLA